MAAQSPRSASFPLSSSRGIRQLPVPSSICTTLPPPTFYQNRQPSLSNESLYNHTQQYISTDSYFTPAHSTPASVPSSGASTPAPATARAHSPTSRRNTRSAATKRTSISSLLSSTDNSSGNDSSAASSPTYNWSGNSSPTTAATTRSNSAVESPAGSLPHGGDCFSPMEYSLQRTNSVYQQDDDIKMYSVSAARKKGRSSPRTPPEDANRDEYDVLGRKKPKTPRTPMSWDPKDDILLKQLKEEQRLGWKEIATHFRGRTSHACQFRWRRLASGQLKYYQGHRRPPPVTTTSASFANEMASTAPTPGNVSPSPKVLMNSVHPISPTANTPRSLHALPQLPPTSDSSLPPMHSIYQSPVHHNWGQSASFFQPTPLPSPNSYPTRLLGEDNSGRDNWSEQEDSILLNPKLSLDEVNVLLAGRSEAEIWARMVKLRGLRYQNMPLQRQHQPVMHCMAEARRDSYEERIPGIGSVGGFGFSR